MHTRALTKNAFTPAKLALVHSWNDAEDVFTIRERAALEWAENLTCISRSHITDFDTMSACSVFSLKEIIDLTVAVGLINAYNLLAISFRNITQEVASH
ncbi:alkylhydroperoxidase family enzyme [Providencia alcalifaciens]|nr:alkylhydroperoxidase family enzyme [Providencia alcalifaciens]